MSSALSRAIRIAQLAGKDEVEMDQVLLGCLLAISRFGIAQIGPWKIDLEGLGVEWMRSDLSESKKAEGHKVTYSGATVSLLDRTALIAKLDGSAELGLEHVLAAFAAEEAGLMGELKQRFGFDSAGWRAAVAQLKEIDTGFAEVGSTAEENVGQLVREYLSPEQAAEELGVHVQTLRGYVRTGKLPAFRLAGDRAIRIRRTDLEKVLEPLVSEKGPTTPKEE